MGIRGAWSLLSHDPRRFGRPWQLHDEEVINREKSTNVLVDGPSLLYHVAVMDVYDQSPPLTHAQISKQGSAHQASPAVIHARITSFLKALLVVAEGDIHVVMDGLAPSAKISTQVDRLRSMAHQGEAHANASTSRCKLLHLLAESAMIEALQDTMKAQSRLYLHQPDRGEAEAYIDNWIKRHSDSTKEVFILSDDTDFLVYSFCPGFIPFKTLEFQVLDGHLCLTGFEYQRCKFLRAFFSTTAERAMTTVAALAGCDYSTSHSLERARTFITQSNIGGLRPRQRNDPSSAAALTAILRYVAHCTRKPSWQDVLAESVFKDPVERIVLVTCLQDIHDIYFPIESTAEFDSFMSVECRRLLECGIVFCRPLIETWVGGNAVQTMSHSRKRSRKTGKNRRKKRQTVHQDSRENESVNDLPSETFVPFPPTDTFVAQYLEKGSSWSIFSQIRRFIYSAVRRYAQSQYDHRIQFHPTWTSSDTVVTEYIRVGRDAYVDFVPKRIMVPAEKTFGRTATSSLLHAILDCIVVEEQLMVPKPLLEQVGVVILASLMLPAKSALLLFLLAKAPLSSTGCTRTASTCATLRDSLLLISLALFHASLIENVMTALLSEAGSSSLPLGRIHVSRILRHDVAAEIFARMENIDDDLVMAEDKGCDASCLHTVVFDNLKVSAMDGLPVKTNEFLTWRNCTKELWMAWCQIYRKQHGCLS